MQTKVLWIFIIFIWSLTACGGVLTAGNSAGEGAEKNSKQAADNQADSGKGGVGGANDLNTEKTSDNLVTDKAAVETQTSQPKTVRDFFTLLPDEYFTLEGCDKATDKNCNKARADYLKTYLEVEDTANGYLKTGCDGGQSCLTMALFKRPDGTYLVAVNNSFESGEDFYFLDYTNGKWTDVSARVVPNFSKKNIYELPRRGTTVKVFAKKYDADYEDGKGARLYDLEWKNGRFTKK